MVKDHYEKLGFSAQDGFWLLDTHAWTPKQTYITINELEHEQK
jgi:hypothetical protein